MCLHKLFFKKKDDESRDRKRRFQNSYELVWILNQKLHSSNINHIPFNIIESSMRNFEREIDKFSGVSMCEFNKIFDTLDLILCEIEAAVDGKGNFAKDKMSAITVDRSINILTDILRCYVYNNIIPCRFSISDDEIAIVIKCAVEVAKLKEMNLRFQNEEQVVKDLDAKVIQIESAMRAIENRITNDHTLSDLDLEKLKRELDRHEIEMEMTVNQIRKHEDGYRDIYENYESITNYYLSLLDSFFNQWEHLYFEDSQYCPK